MKLEDLTKAGFTEEQATKILELHRKAIDGNYVPKQTFNEERDKLKTANETIATRDKQIEELGKFKGTADDLQKKVDELTEANSTAKKEYEEKLKKMEQTSALTAQIVDQVHNPEDILSRIDLTKLTIEGGKVTAGLAEQLDALKKSHPHYFKEAKGDDGKGGLPGGWHPFGKSPEESKSQGGTDSASEFGKSLAKAQSQGIASTQKASDIYFK